MCGVEKNSFAHIINSDLDENEDNNKPTLINHSFLLLRL